MVAEQPASARGARPTAPAGSLGGGRAAGGGVHKLRSAGAGATSLLRTPSAAQDGGTPSPRRRPTLRRYRPTPSRNRTPAFKPPRGSGRGSAAPLLNASCRPRPAAGRCRQRAERRRAGLKGRRRLPCKRRREARRWRRPGAELGAASAPARPGTARRCRPRSGHGSGAGRSARRGAAARRWPGVGAAAAEPPAHGLHHDEEEEVQVPRGAGAGGALLRALRQRHPLLQGAAAGRGQLQRGVLPVGASGACEPSGCRGAGPPQAAPAASFRRAPLESAPPQSPVPCVPSRPPPTTTRREPGRPAASAAPPPSPRVPSAGGEAAAGGGGWGSSGLPRPLAGRAGAGGPGGRPPRCFPGRRPPRRFGRLRSPAGASAGGCGRAARLPPGEGKRARTSEAPVARLAAGQAGCLLSPSALPAPAATEWRWERVAWLLANKYWGSYTLSRALKHRVTGEMNPRAAEAGPGETGRSCRNASSCKACRWPYGQREGTKRLATESEVRAVPCERELCDPNGLFCWTLARCVSFCGYLRGELT